MRDEGAASLKGEEGFSIVELLVAISLFGIVLTAVTGAFISSVQSVDNQRLRTAATRVAVDRLETLRSLPFAELSGQAGQTTVVTPAGRAFPVLTEVTSIDAASGVPPVAPSAVTVKQITVTVSWTSKGTTRQVSYSTAVAPEESGLAVTAPGIGTVVMFPNPAIIDQGGRLLEDVEVTVPLVGFPPTTLLHLSWTNADGTAGARTLTSTGGSNWRGTIVPGEVIGVVRPDGRREMQFRASVGPVVAVYTLALQVIATNPPEITSATIDRNPITVAKPTGTHSCTDRDQCRNTTDVTFTVTATGLDATQDSVILQYQLNDGTFEEMPLTPVSGLWRFTAPQRTTKFLTGASRAFRFTAIRSADGATDTATVVRGVVSA
ncbi:MAG: type II secretion system GspH family protein [Actinomycetota bacterium]|nr:type II secretion system GspH family protein [Actinomycetota bacterium]